LKRLIDGCTGTATTTATATTSNTTDRIEALTSGNRVDESDEFIPKMNRYTTGPATILWSKQVLQFERLKKEHRRVRRPTGSFFA
jgi:hypothetical protein